MKNMTWKILSREELCTLYHTEMQRDFPPDELRPLKTLLELYDTGRYCPYGVFDADGSEQELIGYLNVVHASGCEVAFLDYFATTPALRGAGLGKTLLHTLYETETARGATALLWEAETPKYAPDPAMAERRMGFYQRVGGQPTTLRQRVYGVWFDILCHPCAGSLTTNETEQALLHIYHQLMNPTIFAQEFVLVHTDALNAE